MVTAKHKWVAVTMQISNRLSKGAATPNSPVKPEYHKYEQCNQSKVLTWVGERSNQHRSHTVRSGGAIGSENAGMSSEKASENLARRKPKVS